MESQAASAFDGQSSSTSGQPGNPLMDADVMRFLAERAASIANPSPNTMHSRATAPSAPSAAKTSLKAGTFVWCLVLVDTF